MPHAKLRIDIPEHTWIHAVSTGHPEVTFEVVAILHREDRGVSLIRLHTDDALAVLTDVRARDDVDELDLLWKREDRALLQVGAADPLLLRPVREAGVPLTTPFEIRAGEVGWELTASNERLGDLRTRLETLDIDFTVESVRTVQPSRAEGLLTDRQHEVLRAAADRGYYDTPRETTLTAVADDLDIAKATCSDTLHRAEGTLVASYLNGTPDG